MGNADEACSYFARVGTDLVTHLAQLSSVATELTLNERLHIFRDFFKAGEQAAAVFNIHEHAKRGQHFKDWFCPDSMEFAADHFKLDARYGRVLYLQDYATPVILNAAASFAAASRRPPFFVHSWMSCAPVCASDANTGAAITAHSRVSSKLNRVW